MQKRKELLILISKKYEYLKLFIYLIFKVFK